jgi:tetratricopeptide (TPR) repeat protein
MRPRLTFLVLFITCAWAVASTSETPADLLAQGRVDDAIASLQGKLNSTPNDGPSHNLLCRAYYALGKWDAGISECEKAVALDSGNSQYHLWLGRVYGEKADSSSFLSAAGYAKKTRVEFETAVKLNPANVDAHTDLAEYYIEAPGIMGGGKDKAQGEAQALAKLDPAKVHWVNGRLAEKNKDTGTAEAEYRAAIEASQGSASSWLDLALFYRHAGRPADMEDAIQHASAAPLNQAGVLVDGAEMLIRSGRNIPLAAQLLRRYLTSGATVEDAPAFKAHYLLGTALEKQGDKAAAAAEYRAALALAKGYAPAQEAVKRVPVT